MDSITIPLLDHPVSEEAVFRPENLLDKAAAMLGRDQGSLPVCCLLDFDGELAQEAEDRFGARQSSVWPCFHTSLLCIETDGFNMGLIAGTVGAPFAVLVAEQLIALGCRYIIGYSSSGAIARSLSLPCLVVPNRALRDEGTSYHYLPASTWVAPSDGLPNVLARHAKACGLPVHRGATWTTDAPYRETQTQIDRYRSAGVLTVEMEAAALMALAKARNAEIASLLHVTNTLATNERDFQKGPSDVNQRVLRCCFDAFREALQSSLTREEK